MLHALVRMAHIWFLLSVDRQHKNKQIFSFRKNIEAEKNVEKSGYKKGKKFFEPLFSFFASQ